ncbi:hypothetical protein [Lysobacter sp. HA35]
MIVPDEACGENVDAPADAVLLAAMADLLARQPATALLTELHRVLETLVPGATGGSRLLDRLFARDLVRAAHPDPVDARLRVHMERSAAHAEATQAFMRDVDAAIDAASFHLEALAERLARSSENKADQAPVTPDDPVRLKALDASWRMSRAQLVLARAAAGAVLDQHRHVRDLLVSLWRQGRLAEAAAAHARTARELADLQSALHARASAAPAVSPPSVPESPQ